MQESLITKIKQIFSYTLPKPWSSVLILLFSILVIIPLFIIIHQNIHDIDWAYNLDRITIFILLVFVLYWLLSKVKRIVIWGILLMLLYFMKGTFFRSYGIQEVYEDYRVMMYAMSEDANPQDIIVSKLLPFPNKKNILNAIEYNHPEVRNFALMATSKHFRDHKESESRRRMVQSFAIFKEIRDRWNYVNDPKNREYIAKASESVQHFSGDCEDHAILMSASIKAIGGVTRLIHTQGHIYPELYIGDKSDLEYAIFLIKERLFVKESRGKNIHYHIDERGHVWLNLDYTARYPGGPFMEEIILGQLTVD
ncbi:transglutaminase [Capnocytophaga sp. ARDL2]|uniref:transglutaminase domain-containing protein n=1 Tax=Capnocytophaga sp. ARDL2 TaxID=3238809 RepID=UPI0035576133